MTLILLNPGPVTLSERVRAALVRPDLCHREPEFAELQARIRSGLLAVYGLDPAEWCAVLLTGSGTAAVEAMVGSLVGGNGLAALSNGVYGDRIVKIAETLELRREVFVSGHEEPPDAARLRELDPARSWMVAMVHHETTTGRLNRIPLEAAATLDAPILLDAVSSFGAEEIPFGAGAVEACAATANKCLHGAPGVAFVIVRRARLGGPFAARSVYLDLSAHAAAQDRGDTLFTPAVPACYALDEALAELADQGGWTARRARYRAVMARVRDRLAELGVEPLIAAAESSSVLAAFRVPAGRTYGALHDRLKESGFVIYAGQGALSGRIFRIAVMGAIADADVDRLLEALAAALG